MGTVLKALLQQRHLQTVSAFNREYDRIARSSEPELVGAGPKKAQFYRWLSGNLTSLPYPHHRRILEAMFPGWSADELFDDCTNSSEIRPARENGARIRPSDHIMADVEAIFANRADFLHAMPPRKLFEGTRRIDMAGLSLNLLCQQYSDSDLMKLLDSGAILRCLFLDPNGTHIRARESEEGHAPGVLSSLTELNMKCLIRAQKRYATQQAQPIQIRTYDETVRFNITIVDSAVCIIQPYLPRARGVESPTLVARKSEPPGLFDTFAEIFETMWSSAREVPAV
ncbi:DUF5919 domain-containing protein [Nocardia abscessus]|uniref:DUF5919 domain-containing protein n=1 Tax=Nocardia abscessus TaxID=120957 RepID=UPI0002F6D234|nr:DUF5919 domain-containing protein [Nocardia abscessus]MCC3327398.1 DUF5919 domain-containing protein [Nocardia abscessus]